MTSKHSLDVIKSLQRLKLYRIFHFEDHFTSFTLFLLALIFEIGSDGFPHSDLFWRSKEIELIASFFTFQRIEKKKEKKTNKKSARKT